MGEKTTQARLDYIDFMNIFACFGVVCLHCSGLVFQFSETRAWFVAMLVQTIFHFAVPVFFMISGTTLLEYRSRYSTKTFFKKRFAKTGTPFVFWSLFYLLTTALYRPSRQGISGICSSAGLFGTKPFQKNPHSGLRKRRTRRIFNVFRYMVAGAENRGVGYVFYGLRLCGVFPAVRGSDAVCKALPFCARL